jgi:hypothetical protein
VITYLTLTDILQEAHPPTLVRETICPYRHVKEAHHSIVDLQIHDCVSKKSEQGGQPHLTVPARHRLEGHLLPGLQAGVLGERLLVFPGHFDALEDGGQRAVDPLALVQPVALHNKRIQGLRF